MNKHSQIRDWERRNKLEAINRPEDDLDQRLQDGFELMQEDDDGLNVDLNLTSPKKYEYHD